MMNQAPQPVRHHFRKAQQREPISPLSALRRVTFKGLPIRIAAKTTTLFASAQMTSRILSEWGVAAAP